MQGYYVVAFYQGNFSYRFVAENSTTVYLDCEVASFATEEQAVSALHLLQEGYKFGYLDGLAEAEYDSAMQAEYKN
jgi:hypothetical protein